MNSSLEVDIHRYPFINKGFEILKDLGLTMELIDTTTTYDDMLKEASKDIVDCIIRNREQWDFSVSNYYEVSKYYITMIILKTLPTLITKYFIADYIKRFDKRYGEDISLIVNVASLNKIMIYISNLLQQFAPNLKLLEINYPDFEHTMYGMHMNDYLDIATLVGPNDKREYQQLTLINRNPVKGYVSFLPEDYSLFRYMFHKLIENRIFEHLNKLDINLIKSTKIARCTEQIRKYLVSNTHLKEKIERQDNIQKGIVVPQHQDSANPPCIIHILEKIHKKEKLGHAENVLLGAYLHKRDFTLEQMNDIFKKTVNYNEKVSKYNLEYLKKRDLMPMGCKNLETEQLCYKNDTCIKLHLTSPLGYRNV
jgi:hypothetical protein